MSTPNSERRGVDMAETARRLIIVVRNRMRLYQHLKRAFADNETVRVILDRRVGERRQQTKSHTPERRWRTRRSIDDRLRELGCAIVPLRGAPELIMIRGESLNALAQHPKIYGTDWRTIAIVLGSSSPFNARQIATLLKLDYGSVKRSVRKLVGWNILRRTPAGLVFQPETNRWECQ